jgi:lipoprotein-anchoring transpeptidase ErfK/SrfK
MVLVLIRAAIGAVVLGPMALIGLGAADVAAFNSRAAALEQSWRADQAAGVSAAQLAPARASLQSMRDRRIVAVLPFSVISGALLTDPFTTPETLAAQGQAQALTQARKRAQDDLAGLRETGGPNWDGLQGHMAQLAAARRLPDYVRLANTWEAERGQLGATRDQLSQASGGLADGQPKDVVDGVARLQSVISAAGQAHLSTDPGGQALSRGQEYLKLPYARQLEQHADVAGALKSAGDTVQHRIDVRAQADELVGRIPSLLDQAAKYSVTADFPARTGQAKATMEAAEASGDDGRMDTATAGLKQVVGELASTVSTARQKAAQAAVQAGTGCIPGADPQTIVIHLATQRLIAYDNGCPILNTPITSGRPELPTDRGTFHIFAKYPRYLMHSPWPPGNPFWYKDAWVTNAMEFVSDGTFLHNADWEPPGAYGAGSQNGPYASHGCIHVQDGPLSQLYGWANVGATVIVTD